MNEVKKRQAMLCRELNDMKSIFNEVKTMNMHDFMLISKLELSRF